MPRSVKTVRVSSLVKVEIVLFFHQDSILASRSEAMQNIEQTTIELGEIFVQLATMIRQQEEYVHR